MRHRFTVAVAMVVAAGLASAALGTVSASAQAYGECLVGPGPGGYMCYYYHGSQSSPPDAYGGADEGVGNRDNWFGDPVIFFENPNVNGTRSSRDGLGDPILDNAGSGANGRTDCKAHVYFSPSLKGTEETFSPYPQNGYESPDLKGLYNNNASQNFC